MNAGLPPANLPPGTDIDVEPLIEAFKSFTSSYKFLLLRTILQEIKKHPGARELAIDSKALSRAMLAQAWFPSRHFKLALGQEDKTAEMFSKLEQVGLLDDATRVTADKMRSILDQHADRLDRLPRIHQLAKFPLFVMIRRWFPELGHIKEPRQQVADLSTKYFDERRPLYKLELPADRIVIHPSWLAYLNKHMTIVEGWLDSQWLRFLESRNPNVPSLSAKLWDRPRQRKDLNLQHRYWDIYLKHRPLACIYSGAPVAAPYALDHFLPWSWVGHNQAWNLIPTAKGLNSDKNDRLPPAKLIGKLADAHYQALAIVREIKPRELKKILDDYRLGLRATDAELQDPRRLRVAYAGTVEPMLKLAQRQGFSDWKRKA